jgi:hypothetical protein
VQVVVPIGAKQHGNTGHSGQLYGSAPSQAQVRERIKTQKMDAALTNRGTRQSEGATQVMAMARRTKTQNTTKIVSESEKGALDVDFKKNNDENREAIFLVFCY